MTTHDPFGRHILGKKRAATAIKPQVIDSRHRQETSWKQNLTPFSIHTGIAREEFQGASRLKWLVGFLVCSIGILFIRLWYLQIIRGDDLRHQADVNYRRFHQIRPDRGIIFDRYGLALVTNEPDYVLIVNAAQLPRDEARTALVSRLSTLLLLPIEETASQLDTLAAKGGDRITFQAGIDRDAAIAMLSNPALYPGVTVEILPRRSYVEGEKFGHLVGYMTEIYDYELADDTADMYIAGDHIGREGIEHSYEPYLRGVKGIGEIEVDATGEQIAVRSDPNQLPQTGQNLTLTLDKALQEQVFDSLQKGIAKVNGIGGVAIVLDVTNGEVLSMVSLPGFDSNIFSEHNSAAFTALYAEDAHNPLFNRAISGLYPPGSTFKPFMAAAALEEGIITPKTKLNDPGYLDVGGSRFPCWVYGQYGGSHGSIDVRGAITKSCDVFFYQIGAGYQGQPGLGSDTMKRYSQIFGMGQLTGIDIPGEIEGIITSETDFESSGRDWYWGNTAHMTIGQGYVAITPLELVTAVAAIANGGKLLTPHLVKEVQGSTYATVTITETQVKASGIVSEASLQVVREGMLGTVFNDGGTAPSLRDLPVKVAGKTGTAQHNKSLPDHAWFVSFAPYDDPKIATVVLVEQGGEGSAAAVPVTKEILSWYFTNRGN